MSFSSTQIRKLQRDVKASDIRTREVNGRELAYIEGWHAIAEANRIFGFDGWSRETVESRCVLSRENRGTYHTVYVAKVRVTVRADDHVIVREGFGTGEAQGASTGESHEKAIKTAETDATKRAFATFGKPFGLALYIGSKKRKRRAETSDRRTPDIERRRTLQKLGANGRYYVPARSLPPIDPMLSSGRGELPSPEHALPEILEQTDTSITQNQSTDGNSTQPAANPDTIETHSEATPSYGTLLIERPRRRRDANHLKFVASQPCLICSRTPSDAHHLRFAQPRAMARKVSDEFTVPLCRTHHRQIHQTGDEVQWWMDMDIDPLPIAHKLWDEFQERGHQTSTASVSEPNAPSTLASKG